MIVAFGASEEVACDQAYVSLISALCSTFVKNPAFAEFFTPNDKVSVLCLTPFDPKKIKVVLTTPQAFNFPLLHPLILDLSTHGVSSPGGKGLLSLLAIDWTWADAITTQCLEANLHVTLVGQGFELVRGAMRR